MKIDFQEKIDDYVLGKMSAEDIVEFEKEVSRDKEIQEQLELTQNVCTAIRSRNDKLVMMCRWQDEYDYDCFVASSAQLAVGGGDGCSISSGRPVEKIPDKKENDNRLVMKWILIWVLLLLCLAVFFSLY